ncbi:MAG: helix-turn-helix transcriptional regulator [Eubacterium sp.]|nr:helix-turn-helix transcriptional regulator [Eubacterium sp.]
MNNLNLGAVIARLRKEKGVTQEELAKSVCVSPQAVSKWENGGVPDTELLPKIADYFGVSVDTLFDRSITDYNGLTEALIKKIADMPQEERIDAVFELCWVMEKGITSDIENKSTVNGISSHASQQIYSSMLLDSGYTRMGIGKGLHYFLIVPDIDDKLAAYFDDVDYVELFRDLGDKSVFDALVMLEKRGKGAAFSPDLIMKGLGLDFDKAFEIIKTLAKHGLITCTDVEIEGTTHEFYFYQPSPSFAAMLIFAHEMIKQPSVFCNFMGGRGKSYLN